MRKMIGSVMLLRFTTTVTWIAVSFRAQVGRGLRWLFGNDPDPAARGAHDFAPPRARHWTVGGALLLKGLQRRSKLLPSRGPSQAPEPAQQQPDSCGSGIVLSSVRPFVRPSRLEARCDGISHLHKRIRLYLPC